MANALLQVLVFFHAYITLLTIPIHFNSEMILFFLLQRNTGANESSCVSQECGTVGDYNLVAYFILRGQLEHICGIMAIKSRQIVLEKMAVALDQICGHVIATDSIPWTYR